MDIVSFSTCKMKLRYNAICKRNLSQTLILQYPQHFPEATRVEKLFCQ